MKMKLSKKKKILLGLAIGLISVFAFTGIAYAAYNFWQGSAEVTVEEAMAVYVDGDWEDTNTYTWTASMSPGATIVKVFIVRNNGTASLDITPVVTPATRNSGKITTLWSPAVMTTVWLGQPNQQTFTLSISAAGDATPGMYPFVITFNRQ